MRLDLRLTNRWIDQLWCQAIIVFLFEDDLPQKNYLSRLNEKLAGLPGELLDNQFLTGKKGELLLVAPQDRIKAERLFFVGLGPVDGFTPEIMSSVLRIVSPSFESLQIDEFAILTPCAESDEIDRFSSIIKLITSNFVEYFTGNSDDIHCLLKLVFFVDKESVSTLQLIEKKLDFNFNPEIYHSIVIDNSRGQINGKV